MFDAIVLAVGPHAQETLLGITLAQRGERVARRVGARRIILVDGITDNAELTAWIGGRGDADLLVLRAGDQIVHMPLAKTVIDADGDRRVARSADGSYGGALYVRGAAIDGVVSAVLADPATADHAVLEAWGDAVTTATIPVGAVAFHAATTKDEKKGAKKLLLSLLVKAVEDSPVSKYVYRPLSRPLTVALLKTPITANQVSYFVGVIGLLGCYLTSRPGQTNLIWGAALVFISCIIDGCDGEISRMRLTSSPFGAWLDTVIDELTQVCYFVAIGWHTYTLHPEWWIGASIIVGFVCFVSTIYAIYWFCIVVLKAGGSQYYIGDLEIIETDTGPALRAKHKVSTAPAWLKRLGGMLLLIIRRDFINLAALVLTLFNLYYVIYTGIWIGTVVAGFITVPEHVRLRAQLRQIVARGGVPRVVT